MSLAILAVIFVLMLLGGFFVAFAEGMADTAGAGDGKAATVAFISALVGFVGLISIIVIAIYRLFI